MITKKIKRVELTPDETREFFAPMLTGEGSKLKSVYLDLSNDPGLTIEVVVEEEEIPCETWAHI